MIQNNTFGTCLTHEWFQLSHICTYKKCDMKRKCCSQCINDGIHDHSKPNQNHIMDQQQFLNKIRKDKKQMCQDFSNNEQAIKVEHFLQQLLTELLKIKDLIIACESNVQEQIDILTPTYIHRLTRQVNEADLIDLDDETINKLLNINFFQSNINYKSIQEKLDQIQQQLNKVLFNLKEYQENKYDINKQVRLRKYEILLIQGDDYLFCDSVIISNNEQYLVYNNLNFIKIYDLKLNKLCKSILQKNQISLIQFTFDSLYLFVADYIGFVHGFTVKNDFKKFYSYEIHQEQIQHMKITEKYLITCSLSGTIIKTDFINKQEIFMLLENQYGSKSIDYDDQQGIIISSNNDKSLKIWDCHSQSLLIDIEGNKPFRQVQLINNKKNILCLDQQDNLLKYKIDYHKKSLVE